MGDIFHLTATIFNKRGKIIAHGVNRYEKTHPFQAKLAKKVGKVKKIYLHAEIQAIIRALKSKEQPYRIFVERYDVKGNPRLAKPCSICMLAIQEAGIKIIEYTENMS